MSLTKGILILIAVWIGLGLISLWIYFPNGLIKLTENAPDKLVTLGATFSALALIVERFVSVFVREETIDIIAQAGKVKAEKDKLEKINDARIVASRYEEANRVQVETALMQEVVATTDSVEQRQDDIARKEKKRSQKFQIVSLIVGVVVAALGFRFFGQIAEVTSGVNQPDIASSVFYIADVALSGVLIGGGAGFVDDVIVLLKKP